MDVRNSIRLENKNGLMLVLFTALISGFSIFINSYGVKEFDSSIFTFLKNLVVAVLLFVIVLSISLFSELKKLSKKNWLQLIFIGLIGGSIPFLLFFKGLQMTTGTTSAFIHKTMFVYIAIFAIVFLKEKLTKGLLIGASLLMLGNYLMIKPSFSFSAGHVLIIIATIFWAAENTYAKHVLKEISGTVVAFGRMLFGSLFILIFLTAAGKMNLLGKLTASHYWWIGLSSMFLLLYVITFYNGLKQVKVSTAACILTLGAPVTTMLSWIFSGKSVSLSQALGMLLIVAGIICVIGFSYIVSSAAIIFRVKDYGRN